MEMMEIVLLIAGGIIFILSFFIPDKKNISGQGDGGAEGVRVLAEGELKGLVSQELDAVRTHVDDVVEEAVAYAMEKTERSLERLSNEKIMAVGEYSDTVLAEIHKNHEEAMFLYDMLNNKHISLKNMVSEVNRTVKDAEAAVMSLRKPAPEALSVSAEKVLDRAAEPSAQREPGEFAQGSLETGSPELKESGTERIKTDHPAQQKNGIQKNGIQNTGTQKPAPERPGALAENLNSEKASFMQDADGQGRNNNEKILGLYKQGKSTVDIARELGLGVGEVKLVLDLFKNQ